MVFIPAARGRRIFLTGTSGTGRRTVGALLEAQHGFCHVPVFSPSRVRAALDRLRELDATSPGRDVVVVTSEACAPAVAGFLLESGFERVWLDADRGAARPRSDWSDRPGWAARFVDPFDADGAFRPFERVVADVLASHATSAPARDRSFPEAAGRLAT